MPEIKHAITIERPISDVFRYASNFNNAAEWQPDVKESHQSEERPRVGAFITQTRSSRLFGWRLDLNADIIDYKPNKLIQYKGVLGRFPLLGRLEFQSSSGSTTVTYETTVKMGFLFALLSPLLSGTLNRRTQVALNTLKQTLETSNTTATSFHENL